MPPHMRRAAGVSLALAMLGAAALACNLFPGIPVTPTLAPTVATTAAPSATVTATATAAPAITATPTATPSHTASPTASPTLVPSLMASATFTPTETPTPTATVTATLPLLATRAATHTLTSSPTPSQTRPAPSATPSATASPTATRTTPPSPTPSATPSPTISPTINPTQRQTPSETPTQTPTPSPTPTLLMVLLPTAGPTLRPTATSFGVVTATPLATRPTPTGLPTVIRITTLRPTRTPISTTTAAPPAPTLGLPPLVVTPGASALPTLVGVALTPLPGAQASGTPTPFPSLAALPGADILGVGLDVLQFPPPDTDPATYAGYSVSRDGRRAIITREGRLILDGTTFTGELGTHNFQRFLAARWSPDGRWLAYVVQRPDAEQVGADDVVPTLNDGVWVVQWPGGRPRQVFRSFYVRGSNDWPFQAALDVTWSPDSSLILVTVANADGQRMTALTSPGAVVDAPGPGLPPQQPTFFPLLPYTDATWTLEGTAWTARTVDIGRGTALVILPRDSSQAFTVLDGASAGLWIQNPARLPDGRYAFLGKPSFTGGLEGEARGLRLYTLDAGSAPVAVSPPIPGLVTGAAWSPSRGSLLVYTLDNGAFVVDVEGRVSAVVPGVPAVHWRSPGD